MTTKEEKFLALLNSQREQFARQEEEKRKFKALVKQYMQQGYPRILALSFAKHGQ